MNHKKSTDTKRTGLMVLVALLVCAVVGTDSQVRTDSDAGSWKHTQSISVSKDEDTKANDLTEQRSEAEPKEETYKVVSVVDGDTIKVEYEGKTTSVRLIGVNTPETVDPRKDVECFGKEASQFLKDKLEGKTVTMEADSTQSDRDKYSRLLRYIYLDGEDVNLALIENGYGYEYTYNVPYAKQEQYKGAQAAASDNKRGLWADGVCVKSDDVATTTTTEAESASATNRTSSATNTASKPTTTKPQQQTTNRPQQSTSKPAATSKPQQSTNQAANTTKPSNNTSSAPSRECNIKGNINSKKEKIYHMPGQRNYDDTVIDTSKGERWFCTEQEAVNAGWRKAKR